MSDNIVRLQIKVSGSDTFKEVEVSADELAKAIAQVKKKTEELQNSLINANQIAQAFEQVGAAVQSLQSVMHDLTDSYAVQSAAEARLEQMMRNTMDATDDEIQSIKDLAAEQQKLGVIGDEVILSGAQELATYMQKKESLEALIPVMDDMIAQQYGFNASAESAVSVAQMLGKVFAGETGALKRLGYTFDEAQEAVLKYGTEEEKVAMLTEVVGQIVDGTNAKLAATPYGSIVQTRMAIGDLKEELGKMVAPAMNAVDKIASISIAVAGIGRGIGTVKAAGAAIKGLTSNLRTATAAQKGLNAAMKANVILAVASAVATLVAVLVTLARKSRDATDGMESLKEANEAYKSAASQAKAEIDTETAALKDLMDQGKDTAEAIRKLNEKYGEAFGYHQTAADWYDTLTNKSLAYCKQLGYEAKAKSLSASIGAKLVEIDDLKATLPQGDWKWDASAKKYRDYSTNLTIRYADRDTHIKLAQIANLEKQVEDGEKAMNAAWQEAANAADQLKGNVDGATESVSWQTMSYEDLGKAIKDQTDKLKKYADASSTEAQQEKATLAAMQERYQQLGEDLGLVTKRVKDLNDEIKRTPVKLIPTLQPIAPTTIGKPDETFAPAPGTLNNVQTIFHFNQALAELEEKHLHASKEQLPIIDGQIVLVKSLRDEFEGINKINIGDALTQGWSGLKGIGNSIRDIKDALTETDNAWDALTQTIDGFISLFQSMQQVIEITDAITAATEALGIAKTAETAITKASANAKMEDAAAGAASSVAAIPIVGAFMVGAAVGAVIASLSSLPKFANGALVYGPTLGLMGEYSGAGSNPEVIAPLNKLRAMIGEGGGGKSEVKFRIEGRELVGILNKQNNIYTRSK